MAASQRATAADVGHGAGAECCAVAGASPEFLEVSWKVDISRRCHDITVGFVGLVTVDLQLMMGIMGDPSA